jgi:hypothetical protein
MTELARKLGPNPLKKIKETKSKQKLRAPDTSRIP